MKYLIFMFLSLIGVVLHSIPFVSILLVLTFIYNTIGGIFNFVAISYKISILIGFVFGIFYSVLLTIKEENED